MESLKPDAGAIRVFAGCFLYVSALLVLVIVAISLASRNFPSRHVRHRNAEIWLDTITSSLDRQDASWALAAPLAEAGDEVRLLHFLLPRLGHRLQLRTAR